VRYKITDIAATLSSGSFLFESMIVIPCSMKTAAAIAWGFDDNLLTRAAVRHAQGASPPDRLRP